MLLGYCTFFALDSEFQKIAFTLKTFIKYGSAPEEYGFTPEEFSERWFFLVYNPQAAQAYYVWIRASEVI